MNFLLSQIARRKRMENGLIKLFAIATPYSERRVSPKRDMALKCGGYPDLHPRSTRTGKTEWRRLR
jgi:hypothetical protein